MWRFLISLLIVVALSAVGCSDQSPMPTGVPMSLEELVVSGQKGPPQGNCPDIYYESTYVVDSATATTVTWTSSFGGFDYTRGEDYTVTVSWSVSNGVASFAGFSGRKKVWTPKGTLGSWNVSGQTANTIDLTVNTDDMHRSVEPDWAGYIENNHFTLKLIVNGVEAKFGVNIHLEDPDEGYNPRCPQSGP